jgi:DNA/RNA-binding domain of Phe-tRNA-synthetase-like protein
VTEPPALPPEPQPSPGWVAPELAEEFPELRLWSVTVAAHSGRSPEPVRERLRALSDRIRGPQALALRSQPVPWAYRVFFRHIGLDPDEQRTPVEALALERLLKGGLRSESLLDDALTIAVLETGVPLWGLDADRLDGELGLRGAAEGESLGRGDGALALPAGRLVVADSTGPVAVLFGDAAAGAGVTRETTRMALFSVQVAGVPTMYIEEALWTATDILVG